MSVNIDALFQHLMKDPDIIPPEGEDKEAIAMAMAKMMMQNLLVGQRNLNQKLIRQNLRSM